MLCFGPVGDGETNDPENGGEQKGDDEQEEAAHHSHPGREDPGLGQLQVQLVRRLHLVHPAIGGELGHAGSLHHLGAGVQGHLQEGNCHGEQHPDVNHLDIGSDWQALGDSKEPTKRSHNNNVYKLKSYLQGSQDQEDGEVDLNNQVNVVISKEPCNEADGKEGEGWDEDCQDIADDWSS